MDVVYSHLLIESRIVCSVCLDLLLQWDKQLLVTFPRQGLYKQLQSLYYTWHQLGMNTRAKTNDDLILQLFSSHIKHFDANTNTFHICLPNWKTGQIFSISYDSTDQKVSSLTKSSPFLFPFFQMDQLKFPCAFSQQIQLYQGLSIHPGENEPYCMTLQTAHHKCSATTQKPQCLSFDSRITVHNEPHTSIHPALLVQHSHVCKGSVI